MIDRKRTLVGVVLVLGGLLAVCPARAAEEAVGEPAVLPAPDVPAEEIPGQGEYQKTLAEAEKAYIAAIMKARKEYIAAIRDFQMRASMTPEAAQKLEAEVKRIESLPAPRVIPEPQPEAGKEQPKTEPKKGG